MRVLTRFDPGISPDGGRWGVAPRVGTRMFLSDGYSYVPLRHPPPRPRFTRVAYPYASLPPRTPPALHPGGIPIRFSATPYPARAARSSPAPSRGRGQSWRYPGKAVPGDGADAGFPGEGESRLVTGSSPGSPRALDRGGYRHGGRGPGRGTPSPHGDTRAFLPEAPTLPGLPPAGTNTLLRQPPLPPAGRGRCPGVA